MSVARRWECNREAGIGKRLRSCLPRGEVTTLFRLHFCAVGEVAFARTYQQTLFHSPINYCISWVYDVGCA
jgi:hypothetical protein